LRWFSRDGTLPSNLDDAEIRDMQAKLFAFLLALLHTVISSYAPGGVIASFGCVRLNIE